MEMPFGGTQASRHLRDRHPRGGVGRHHDDRRLRRAGARAAGAGPGRALAREGRRQLRDRLRLPPDHRRGQRRVAQGDGRADRRGHHQLQAVHGLPRRLPVQRRADPAGDADRGRQRRADHDARRERLGHRRAGAAGARARRHRARTSTASPGRGRPSRRPRTARSCWPTSPARRCTSCTCRPSRRWPASPRPATPGRTSSARPARSTSTSRWRRTSARRSGAFEGAKWVCSTPLRSRARGPPGRAVELHPHR